MFPQLEQFDQDIISGQRKTNCVERLFQEVATLINVIQQLSEMKKSTEWTSPIMPLFLQHNEY